MYLLKIDLYTRLLPLSRQSTTHFGTLPQYAVLKSYKTAQTKKPMKIDKNPDLTQKSINTQMPNIVQYYRS
jgi:hypothetical protein